MKSSIFVIFLSLLISGCEHIPVQKPFEIDYRLLEHCVGFSKAEFSSLTEFQTLEEYAALVKAYNHCAPMHNSLVRLLESNKVVVPSK